MNTADYHPASGEIPMHVGIIPDGGRRWAKIHNCSLQEAYQRSRTVLRVLVDFLFNYGVKEISIYLSSIQNFRWDPSEIDASLGQIETSLNNELTEIASQNDLKVVIAGKLEILPASLQTAISEIEKNTCNNTKGRLNLLIAYDPLEEIIKAFNTFAGPETFHSRLWITSPVDLVIRSGGAQLLSNFLPLQSAYARLHFTDKLINDLLPDDLVEILRKFSIPERKFGT